MMSGNQVDMPPSISVIEDSGTELSSSQVTAGDHNEKTVIESEMLPLTGLLSDESSFIGLDSACAMYAAALPAHLAGSLPEGTVLQLSPETGIVTVASIPGISRLDRRPVVGDQQSKEILMANREPIFGVLEKRRDVPEIDLASLLADDEEEEESCNESREPEAPSPVPKQSPVLPQEQQDDNSRHDAADETAEKSSDSGGNPSVVTIDVSKPIQLCQNSLIVVNGQKCVLQHNPDTGQVVAYPVKEPDKPRKKRGRPRKVVQNASNEEQQNEMDDSYEDDSGDTGSGMVHITNEDGSLVKRSRRRRKKAKFLRDYETGNLRNEIGSDEEIVDAGVVLEPETPPRKKVRGRGRPKKSELFNPFPFLKAKRGRGRPRRYGLKEQMQGFLIQMADGQSLMMQIPASSLPKDMSLQEVAQNIAQSLNAAAQLSPTAIPSSNLQEAAPSTAGDVEPPEIPTSEALETNAIPSSPCPVQAPPQAQSVAKKRGRPRKHPLSNPYHVMAPPPPASTGPNIILLTPAPEPESSAVPSPSLESAKSPDVFHFDTNENEESGPPTDSRVANGLSMDGVDETNSVHSVDSTAQAHENCEDQFENGEMSAFQQERQNSAFEGNVGTAFESELVEAPGELFDAGQSVNIPATVIPLPENLMPLLNKQELPIKLGLKATGSELERLRCGRCDFQAFYEQQFQEHLSTHEDTEKCKCCNFVSLGEDEMVAHYKEHHPRCICNVCNHTAERAYLIRRHATQHNDSVVTCDICGKTYKDSYILNMHVKLVHMPSNIMYECDVCLKKFNRKAHLKRHLRTHDPDKPFKCTHCEYRGCEKSDITKHMLIHQEPKHYCNICGKAFRHIKNKELHVKRHKGQRDYKCGVCEFYGYTFTDIRKHIERRHTDAKTLICDVCGQAFKNETLLKEHQEEKQCEVYLIEDSLEIEDGTHGDDDSEFVSSDGLDNADGQCLTTSNGTITFDSLPRNEDGHIVLNQEEVEALAKSGHLTIVTSGATQNAQQIALISNGEDDDYERLELENSDAGTLISCSEGGGGQPVAVMTSDGLMLHVVV